MLSARQTAFEQKEDLSMLANFTVGHILYLNAHIVVIKL